MRYNEEIKVPEHKQIQEKLVCDHCGDEVMAFLGGTCVECCRDLCSNCSWQIHLQGKPAVCKTCESLNKEKKTQTDKILEIMGTEMDAAINSIKAKYNTEITKMVDLIEKQRPKVDRNIWVSKNLPLRKIGDPRPS